VNRSVALALALFISTSSFLSAEEDHAISPVVVGLVGIIPGAGQAYLGNNSAALAQSGMFLGSGLIAGTFFSKKDYIAPRDQTIQFDYKTAIIGDALRRAGFLYLNVPFLTEADWQRAAVMLKYHELVQINPLLKYGNYQRTNTTTINSEIWGEPSNLAIFYSSYSSYRDAGGLPDKKNETFWDLAVAPFAPENLTNPWVFIPIGTVLAISSIERSPRTVVNPQLMNQKGVQFAYAVVPAYGAGVGEEAFFRGFLNHAMSTAWGPELGITTSSLIFGLSHLGNSPTLRAADVLPQIAGGFYLGYVQYKHHWDLGPGIAFHFWWDVIQFAFEIKSFHGDPSASKNQRQVHYMPLRYTMSF